MVLSIVPTCYNLLRVRGDKEKSLTTMPGVTFELDASCTRPLVAQDS